jgi:serine/threonine-protein kinase SRPK3
MVIFHSSSLVALKVVVARQSGRNNESKLLQWLGTRPKEHRGHIHILKLLDLFHIEGPNGTHEVLVTDVVCTIRALHFRKLLSPLSATICYQAMLGLAYLQEHGVTHGGT